MAKIDSLEKVFHEELKDIYNAESQLMKALPKMVKAAASSSLKEALQNHMEETQGQIDRLNKIAQTLKVTLTGKTCKAMKGLIEEGSEVMEEKVSNPALKDVMLIGAAQRVEHYEIAAYGTARAIAEALGLEDIAALLQETLDEESRADELLSEISEGEVLADAGSEEDEEYDSEEDDNEAGDEDADEGDTRVLASKRKSSASDERKFK